MPQTFGLTHIHLVVADIPRSLAFYTDVFEMEELFGRGKISSFSAHRARRT
jgi:catechol 2,3-dioxygenase-like lactoylglutathione lyase family enzyme